MTTTMGYTEPICSGQRDGTLSHTRLHTMHQCRMSQYSSQSVSELRALETLESLSTLL